MTILDYLFAAWIVLGPAVALFAGQFIAAGNMEDVED